MRPFEPPTFLRKPLWRVVLAGAALSCVAAAGAAMAGSAPEANLLKVRVGGDTRQTRVVIELDKTASGKLVSDAAASKHVVLALPHVDIAGEMNGQGEGLVKSWSVDSAAGAARIKFDLRRDAVVRRRFLLPPGDGLSVYRYVVDLDSNDTSPATPVEKASETRSILAKTAAVSDDPQVRLPPQGKKVVVIDAGHGGKDSGALGSNTREKDDTLAAAHALRDRLEQTGRYKVVMTATPTPSSRWRPGCRSRGAPTPISSSRSTPIPSAFRATPPAAPRSTPCPSAAPTARPRACSASPTGS